MKMTSKFPLKQILGALSAGTATVVEVYTYFNCLAKQTKIQHKLKPRNTTKILP